MVFGDSEHYQGQAQWSKLTAGIGQGNGAGTHIWAAVSMPLFKVMHKEGLVALFVCTLSKMQSSLVGLAFVDNTDLIVNDESQVAEQGSRKCRNC